MKRVLIFAGLSTLTLLTSACATTTRGDVREARRNVGEAYLYGNDRDVRQAEREYRETRRDYRRERRDSW